MPTDFPDDRVAATGVETAAEAVPGCGAGALYRLLSWLSPAYPVGAYTYSHGLEWCVETGEVSDAEALHDWLEGVVRYGGGRADAVLAAHAYRASGPAALLELDALALALAPSRERRLETGAQGRAFVEATRRAWPCARLRWLEERPAAETAYPVAVATAAAGHGVPLPALMQAYLHAFVSNLISAGVRLVPLGQSDGQRLLRCFEPVIAEVAAEAEHAPLAGLGGCALLADVASMLHETQYSRLFRS